MWTEGRLPGEMQPPLNSNSLSRRGWGFGGGVGWVWGWAVAAWGFQLSPPPLPTGFAAATLTHVSFPAPHFLLKEITHTFLLETGSNPPSRKQRTCLRAAPRWGPQQVAGQCPLPPPLPHRQKELSWGERLLCMGSEGPEPHLGQSGLHGVCTWNERTTQGATNQPTFVPPPPWLWKTGSRHSTSSAAEKGPGTPAGTSSHQYIRAWHTSGDRVKPSPIPSHFSKFMTPPLPVTPLSSVILPSKPAGFSSIP